MSDDVLNGGAPEGLSPEPLENSPEDGPEGCPDSPEGYDLAGFLKGHEIDPNFAGAMGEAMHGAGLSKSQAQKIARAWQEEWQSAMEGTEARYESEKAEVLKSVAPGRIEAARRAFRAAGVSADLAEGIERGIGPMAAVELFAALGGLLSEDRPPRGALGHNAGGAESVRLRIDQLMADPDFQRRYQRGDESALREIGDLSKRATA